MGPRRHQRAVHRQQLPLLGPACVIAPHGHRPEQRGHRRRAGAFNSRQAGLDYDAPSTGGSGLRLFTPLAARRQGQRRRHGRCTAAPARCRQAARRRKLVTAEGYGTFDVAADKRLVLAIEQDGQGATSCMPAAATPGARPAGSSSSTASRPGRRWPSRNGWPPRRADRRPAVVPDPVRPRHDGAGDQPAGRIGTSRPRRHAHGNDHAARAMDRRLILAAVPRAARGRAARLLAHASSGRAARGLLRSSPCRAPADRTRSARRW